jgi:hypothetical protein
MKKIVLFLLISCSLSAQIKGVVVDEKDFHYNQGYLVNFKQEIKLQSLIN